MEEINRTIIILLMLVFICVPLASHLWAQQDVEKIAAELVPRGDTGSLAEEPELSLKSDVEYTAENLRDPFESYLIKEEGAAVEQVSPSLAPLIVQGIIWGGSFPQAIINNKVVKIGDEIEGVRIIDISKDGVSVSYGLRSYNLSAPGIVQMENLPR